MKCDIVNILQKSQPFFIDFIFVNGNFFGEKDFPKLTDFGELRLIRSFRKKNHYDLNSISCQASLNQQHMLFLSKIDELLHLAS